MSSVAYRTMTAEEKVAVLKERYKLKKKRSEMYSLWCDALYKLSIANHVSLFFGLTGHHRYFFYGFVHSFVTACSTIRIILTSVEEFTRFHRISITWVFCCFTSEKLDGLLLNKLVFSGGDMTRSILLFAKGMPLGEGGLDMLKIHLINLTGLKKK